MLQVPIEVWLGQHQGIELLLVYAVQSLWLLVLVAIGRYVLQRAVRRVVVQGG
jgi:ABC-2 type transport system permease protein